MWKENKEEMPDWLKSPDGKQSTSGNTEATPLLGSGDKTDNDVEKGDRKNGKNSKEDDDDKDKTDSYQKGGGKQKKKKKKGSGSGDDDGDDGCYFTEFCANIFVLISTVSVLVHFSLLCGQILPIFTVKEVDTLQIALRVYLIIFLIGFILIECEFIFQNNILGNNFVVRGIMYSFVGLIAVEQSAAIRVDMSHGNHIASVWAQISSLILHISAWFETAMGCLYFVLGIFCMREMRDQMRHKEVERKEKARLRREALEGDLDEE